MVMLRHRPHLCLRRGLRGSGTGGRPSGQISTDFEGFAGQRGNETDAGATSLASGSIGRGVFQNMRITADTSANSIVIYSNQEDFRIIEGALREPTR